MEFQHMGRCSTWQNKDCSGGFSAFEPYIVTHNQLLAHGVSVNIYKTKYQVYGFSYLVKLNFFFTYIQASQKGIIGISLACQQIVPPYDTELDHDAAERALDFIFGWQLLYEPKILCRTQLYIVISQSSSLIKRDLIINQCTFFLIFCHQYNDILLNSRRFKILLDNGEWHNMFLT